ncbi:MAG: hypothetical protein IT228_08070 [Flavobacteriales bacterium]|nr:hypothetical protein [Flavobacteriales bacterium]MCC6577283.1 hypothetical protein [Flavobacteriales bacterium]
MHPLLRNSLAVVAGILLGSLVNMGLILLGGTLLPPPPGVDVNDVASINAHIDEYSVAQMMVPFLAHAIGTLIGAFTTARIAASWKLTLALTIGVFFLLGGVMAARMIPDGPLWFTALDLGVAYLPMAWLGHRLATGKSGIHRT